MHGGAALVVQTAQRRHTVLKSMAAVNFHKGAIKAIKKALAAGDGKVGVAAAPCAPARHLVCTPARHPVHPSPHPMRPSPPLHALPPASYAPQVASEKLEELQQRWQGMTLDEGTTMVQRMKQQLDEVTQARLTPLPCSPLLPAS